MDWESPKNDHLFDFFVFIRYANRAKNIKNKPKINEDPKDALLREFQEEIARLKAALGGKPRKKGERRKKRRIRRGPDGECWTLVTIAKKKNVLSLNFHLW